MSHLAALRRYAEKTDLSSIPASILFSSTDAALTIFDAYPKSHFHFLVLPRIHSNTHDKNMEASTEEKIPMTPSQLSNLRSLLKCDLNMARSTLMLLKEEGIKTKQKIEEEMVSHFGFRWEVWMGFHACPSMDHLHLHVLSADLCSEKMKHKKHYNSFHPKLGFFLHIDEVLSWLDAEPSYFAAMAALKKSQYEPLLKDDLACFHCEASFKTMPKLKEHMQADWDKMAKKGRVRTAKAIEATHHKRKLDDTPIEGNTFIDDDKGDLKRQRVDTIEDP